MNNQKRQKEDKNMSKQEKRIIIQRKMMMIDRNKEYNITKRDDSNIKEISMIWGKGRLKTQINRMCFQEL